MQVTNSAVTCAAGAWTLIAEGASSVAFEWRSTTMTGRYAITQGAAPSLETDDYKTMRPKAPQSLNNLAANDSIWVMPDGLADGVVEVISIIGGTLPYALIPSQDAGGTVNALEITTYVPVADGMMVWFAVAATNTASPATISINGGDALTISDSDGVAIGVGDLASGIGVVEGTKFRLLDAGDSVTLDDVMVPQVKAGRGVNLSGPALAGLINDEVKAIGDLVPTNVSGLVRIGFENTGDILAVGANSRDDNFVRAWMWGAGQAKDGDYGLFQSNEGHATWNGLFPKRNYSSLEFALHPTMASGLCSYSSGGNTVTRTSGAAFDASWVGRRFYMFRQRYKISAVSGDTITLTNIDGSPVSFGSSGTGKVWKVCFVKGSGTGVVAGTTFTRTAGDPLVLYYSDPSFEFRLDGVTKTVSGGTAPDTYTLSSPPANGTYAYEFYLTINDQFSTLRLHGTEVDAENLSIYTHFDGHWIESQYGSYGQHQPIWLSTGEYSAGNKYRQIGIQPTGELTLGGDYGRDTLRLLSPLGITPVNRLEIAPAATGFGPILRARGGDANVSSGVDLQGTGRFDITGNSFDHFIARFIGGLTDKNYLEFISGANGVDPTIRAKASGTDTSSPVRLDGFGTSGVALRVSNNNSNTVLFEVKHDRFKSMVLPAYADDTAAAAGGIAVGEWFHSTTSGAIRQRRS